MEEKIRILLDAYKEEREEIIKCQEYNEVHDPVQFNYMDGKHYMISEIISDLELLLKNLPNELKGVSNNECKKKAHRELTPMDFVIKSGQCKYCGRKD